MAAFTALALGIGALAGHLAARKGKGGIANVAATAAAAAGKPPVSAPAPTDSSLAAPAPPDASLAASNATKAAQQAALKVRRKATSVEMGGIGKGVGLGKSSIATATPILQPKSLSGY